VSLSTATILPTHSDRLPAWPVLVTFWGFPVMWLLGVTVVPAAVLTAAVMIAFLLHQGRVLVVPAVGVFAGLLLWILASSTMLDSGPRALGFLYRFIIIGFAFTALVYALNARRHLTLRAVVNALTFVWAFVVIGGNLGLLFPNSRLTTPMGLILPGSLTSNPYVRDLFFPPLAEVQHPWGSPLVFVRPSAPFPYANSWGSAVLILTPVAIAAFLMARSRWTRAAIAVLGIALVPAALATTNRAMFAALGLAVTYIALRLAVRGRAAPAMCLTAAGVAVTLFLLSRGLIEQIATRQQFGKSSGGRLTLYAETIDRTMSSPLFGYGAPRPSNELGVSVGTQGYAWALMFSHGFVGLALFLLFLWGTTVITWPAAGDVHVVLHSVLVVESAAVVVYGLDIIQMLSLVLVAALLLRQHYGLDVDADADP